MKDEIMARLAKIEKANNIQMLYVCESGSRAWQFPSPDSDYDVRFIYVRPFDHYLSITEKQDHLDFPITDELDIYGWDLRKVLQLMKKSNTTPFEWLQSPVIYREAPGFREALWQLCAYYFNQRSNSYHYLGIVKQLLDVEAGEISIKKLFYVVRSLLSARWCLERNSIAPLTIHALMELLPAALYGQVKKLIALKAISAEAFRVNIEGPLLAYIQEAAAKSLEQASALDKSACDAERLNDFFRKMIKQYDYSSNEAERVASF